MSEDHRTYKMLVPEREVKLDILSPCIKSSRFCLYKFFSNQLHVSKFVINLNQAVKLYSVYYFDTVGNFLELFIAQTFESLIIGGVDADKWKSLDLTNKRLVSIS